MDGKEQAGVVLPPNELSGLSAPGEFNVSFGKRIRAMRKLRGMSLSELAANLSLSFQQVQKYEQGKNRVTVATMLRIAQILEVDPSVLLRGAVGQSEGAGATECVEMTTDKMAERVKVVELYFGISEPSLRLWVLNLLKLLGKSSRQGTA